MGNQYNKNKSKSVEELYWTTLLTHCHLVPGGCSRIFKCQVSIGSGNGLVPPGNKPLPEPMLTQNSRHTASPLSCLNYLTHLPLVPHICVSKSGRLPSFANIHFDSSEVTRLSHLHGATHVSLGWGGMVQNANATYRSIFASKQYST